MNSYINFQQAIVRQLQLGPMMNYIYIVGCQESKEAAVIDPSWDEGAILDAARNLGLNITAILLTHGHPDHINALGALLKATQAKVYLHADERAQMREAASLFQMRLEFLDRASDRIHSVLDGETIHVGRLNIRAIHTPGHSPGSLCFLVGKSLFSGDTLFVGACGRVDLPGGDPEKMWYSLNHTLKALDDDIVLYPGHNYGASPSSTLGEEKRHNIYMKYPSLSGFLREMSGY